MGSGTSLYLLNRQLWKRRECREALMLLGNLERFETRQERLDVVHVSITVRKRGRNHRRRMCWLICSHYCSAVDCLLAVL
jgi:hypothetical protein